MNPDGQPHSNRAFRVLLRDVVTQLRNIGTPLRVIHLVVAGMVRHENRKRHLHPSFTRGQIRGPVPQKIIDAALILAHRRRAA